MLLLLGCCVLKKTVVVMVEQTDHVCFLLK